MQRAQYSRLYADAAGETHFAEVEHTLAPQDFAPPAPPLQIAALFPATRCGLVGAPANWGGTIPLCWPFGPSEAGSWHSSDRTARK